MWQQSNPVCNFIFLILKIVNSSLHSFSSLLFFLCSSTCSLKVKTYDLQPHSAHLLSCTYLINLNWEENLPTFKNKSTTTAEYCINKGLVSFFFLKKSVSRKFSKKKKRKNREHGGSLLGFLSSKATTNLTSPETKLRVYINGFWQTVN